MIFYDEGDFWFDKYHLRIDYSIGRDLHIEMVEVSKKQADRMAKKFNMKIHKRDLKGRM